MFGIFQVVFKQKSVTFLSVAFGKNFFSYLIFTILDFCEWIPNISARDMSPIITLTFLTFIEFYVF